MLRLRHLFSRSSSRNVQDERADPGHRRHLQDARKSVQLGATSSDPPASLPEPAASLPSPWQTGLEAGGPEAGGPRGAGGPETGGSETGGQEEEAETQEQLEPSATPQEEATARTGGPE